MLKCDVVAGASFAENFYGLKRRRRPIFETERATAAVGGVPPEEKLGSREIWGSLLFLVSLPSLRIKIMVLISNVLGI